jgi:RNA polymerase sigma factor (sigma-70 family)
VKETAEDEESVLVRQAVSGDRRAFEQLVRRHQAAVRALSRRLSGSNGEGDDIAQSAFLQAWRRRRTWRGGSFKGWVCTIAYRIYLKGRSRPLQELGEEADLHTEAHGERLDLAAAFRRLPRHEAAAVALCLGAGLSHTEAAEAMDAPVGSVKSWVLRGRSRLQLSLAAYVQA